MKNILKYLAGFALTSSLLISNSTKAQADKIVINQNITPGVNVRSTAQVEEDNILGGIDFPVRYHVRGQEKDWYQVSFEGKKGYVGKEWFYLLEEISTINDTKLYEKADDSSKSIENIDKGGKVTLLAYADKDFVKVELDKKENKKDVFKVGYIKIKDLSISKLDQEDLKKSKDKYSEINKTLEEHKDDNQVDNQIDRFTRTLNEEVDLEDGSQEEIAETITYQYFDVSGTGEDVYWYATNFLGNPYVFGGNDLLKGIDCSGFTQQVYAQFGVALPRIAQQQYFVGNEVFLGNEKAGDLVFYGTSPRNISHVAIADGEGGIVHASSPRTGIITSSIGNPIAIRRIIE